MPEVGSLTTGSPTGSLSSFGESGLNVQSGHSKNLVFCSKVRAVLHRSGVTEKVTKTFYSFLGSSSPVAAGVREPMGASCVGLLGCGGDHLVW